MTDGSNQFTCNDCGEVFIFCQDESSQNPGEGSEVLCPLCGSRSVTDKSHACNSYS